MGTTEASNQAIGFSLGESAGAVLESTNGWWDQAVNYLPMLVAATVVFTVFLLLSRLANRFVSRLGERFSRNPAATNIVSSVASLVVVLIGIFIVLGMLNLDKTVTSLLAGAGVIGLILGFAFQEIAANFLSGVIIAFDSPYRKGDIVEIDQYFGEVTEIGLRTTRIKTFQGLDVLIPNKTMFMEALTNYTKTDERRLDISVGVSYSDDLRKVGRVTQKALEKIEDRIKDKPVEVFFTEFGESSINLTARVWIPYPRNQSYVKALHQAVIAIKEAYDEHGITIPFPIRTMDFGMQDRARLNREQNGMQSPGMSAEKVSNGFTQEQTMS